MTSAALISRQFRPIPRSRIESLLASFPKLIPEGSQHTTVENAEVRFVYQPFEEVYVVLVTNKGSNILQVSLHLSVDARIVLETALASLRTFETAHGLSCRLRPGLKQ
jgi:hypothetical protein